MPDALLESWPCDHAPVTVELSRPGTDESDTYTSLVWLWADPIPGACPSCGSGLLATCRDLIRADGNLVIPQRFTECAADCGWRRME